MSEAPQFPPPTAPVTADHPQVQAFAQMGPLSDAMLKASEDLIAWTTSFVTLAHELANTVQSARAVIEAAEQPSRQ